jgi:diadenosine tetraphosphate (Ap4A) HIT family hydrolase
MNSAGAPASAFTLDPQLERDTVVVGDLPLARVLLMNDANFPWLILVPRQEGVVEIFDLAETVRTQLMQEIALVARHFKALTGCDKINIAAIGNVVAQLHIHIVARRRDDPAWPRPVFGVLPPRPYAEPECMAFIEMVRRKLILR